MIASSTNESLAKKSPERGHFLSKNLEGRMNEYLNSLLQKSEEEYQEKVERIQLEEEIQRVKENRKYATHTHYYKIMKSSKNKVLRQKKDHE